MRGPFRRQFAEKTRYSPSIPIEGPPLTPAIRPRPRRRSLQFETNCYEFLSTAPALGKRFFAACGFACGIKGRAAGRARRFGH
jgi:hypothetical protein